MKQIDKPYERAFLLEPTKLTRLIDKIHERLGDHQNTTTHDSFEVFLSDKRHEKLTSVDQVLAVENSRKRKIERLLIVCSAAIKEGAYPAHEIQVDFGKNKTPGDKTKITEISVRSEVAGWADRALSEVEEQVERTWLRYGVPALGIVGLLFCLVGVFVLQIPSVDKKPRSEMGLRDADLDRVDQIVSQNRTITDEETREITTRQLRNALEDARPKLSPQKTWTRQRILASVPLVILFGCAIALMTCYPSAVFYWGDEVGRYDAMMQRRKALWQIIIGVTIIGVLATFFSTSLLSWLPPE